MTILYWTFADAVGDRVVEIRVAACLTVGLLAGHLADTWVALLV